MSEMQLQLNITSNATAAEQALSKLAGALGRLRGVVKSGLGLDKVANGLAKVTAALSAGISEDNVARLERVATAMERMKDIGAVKVNIGDQAKDMDRAMARAGDGAERVQETNERVSDTVRDIAEQYVYATSKLDTMRMKAEGLKDRLAQGVDTGKFDDYQIGSHIARIRDLNDAIEQAEKAETAANGSVTAGARMMADEYVNGMTRVQLAMMRIEAMHDQLAQGIQSGWNDARIAAYASQIQNLRARLLDATNAQNGMNNAINGIPSTSADVHARSLDQVKNSSERAASGLKKYIAELKKLHLAQNLANTTLGRLISQFSRIAKMRMMRYVIREIAKSMKEGLENYKEYSKAIGGDYYKAISSLNDATLKMKNSIGAALAPAIRALIPFVNQLVSGFINLLNIVNQFLALLTGQQTWSMALDYPADALEDTTNNANAAHKAVNELLADFDELNIIQSESGGGVGGIGGNETDYTQMFQEMTVFDSKIKSIVNWLKDNLGLVKNIAISIGAAIAAWKIGSLFGAKFKTLIGLALTFYGIASMITGVFDQLNNGIDLSNMIQVMTGAAAVAIGLGIAFGWTGFAIGLLIGGVVSLIAPLKELAETGKLTDEALTQLEFGIAAIAGGIAILTGSWIPLLIGALVGIGVAIYARWDEIKAWYYDKVVPWLAGIVQWIVQNVINPIIDWWESCVFSLRFAWEAIKSAFISVWEDGVMPMVHIIDHAIIKPIEAGFTNMAVAMAQTWADISTLWHVFWEDVMMPMVEWIDTNIVQPIAAFFSVLWGTITNDPNNNLAVWWGEFWANDIAPVVDTIRTDIVDPVVDFFVGIWDAIKGAYASVAAWWNGFWAGIAEWALGAYNSIAKPITAAMTGVWTGIETVYNDAAGWWNRFWEDDIMPVANWVYSNIINPIATFFSSLWGTITGDPNNNLAEWFSGFWANSIAPIVGWIDTNIVQKIAGFFTGLWGTLTGDPSNNLAEWWNNLWNNDIRGVANQIEGNIITPIKNFFSGLWQNVTNSSVVSGVISWWNGLWMTTLKGPVDWIKEHIIDKITGFFSGLWGTITGDENNNIVAWFKGIFGEGGDLAGVANGVKTYVVDVLGGYFAGLWGTITGNEDNNLVEWWNGLFGENGSLKGVVDGIEDLIITPIKNFFSGLWKSIMNMGKDEEGNGGVEAWWNGIFGEGGFFAGALDSIDQTIIQPIKDAFSGLWASIMGTDENGETKSIGDWWTSLWTDTFGSVAGTLNENVIVPIATHFYSLKTAIADAADKAYDSFKTAWTNIGNWFYDHVSMPIANFFIDAMNGVIAAINAVIDALNSVHITIPGVTVFGKKLWDDIPVGISGIVNISYIPRWEPRAMAAGGLVNTGEMFIAREAGPEMVGRIGSRSAVANNDQIVNGISSGVAEGMGRANEETDALLGQAVSLLGQILRKTGQFQPSGAMGKVVKQSMDMYQRAGG